MVEGEVGSGPWHGCQPAGGRADRGGGTDGGAQRGGGGVHWGQHHAVHQAGQRESELESEQFTV